MEEREKIREFILKELAWEKTIERFDDDYMLLENGIIDSLAMIKAIGYIESTFSIKLQDEDFIPDNFETVNCIVRMIECRRDGRKNLEN